jgi:hypothetical protein
MIPPGGTVHKFILRMFAKTGHSPTLADIQREFALAGLGEADSLIVELERHGSVHRSPGDRAITHAYPFSNEPTAHRVQLADEPEVYAMCAIDALGMPFMLRRDAEIRSLCGHCGKEARIQIQAGQLRGHHPQRLVVWLPTVKEKCVTAIDLCPNLNFFCSPAHLKQWRTAHPEHHGQMLTLVQALEKGRNIFEPFLSGMTEEESYA